MDMEKSRNYKGVADSYECKRTSFLPCTSQLLPAFHRRKKTTPLTEPLQKGVAWCWSNECEEGSYGGSGSGSSRCEQAFSKYKPMRRTGGVLLQDGHPVVLESHKLSEAERRYRAQEKELLAVIHCLRTWKHGSKFLVKRDNSAVSHFLTQPKLTPKQACWQEFLAEFYFQFEHKAGHTNQVADVMQI